jgi:hypothetical protein
MFDVVKVRRIAPFDELGFGELGFDIVSIFTGSMNWSSTNWSSTNWGSMNCGCTSQTNINMHFRSRRTERRKKFRFFYKEEEFCWIGPNVLL